MLCIVHMFYKYLEEIYSMEEKGYSATQMLKAYIIHLILKSFIFFGSAFSMLMILFKIFNMTTLSWWIVLSPIVSFMLFALLSFASIGMYVVLSQIKAIREYEHQIALIGLASKDINDNEKSQG